MVLIAVCWIFIVVAGISISIQFQKLFHAKVVSGPKANRNSWSNLYVLAPPYFVRSLWNSRILNSPDKDPLRMNIVIFGAGTVGTSIAELLCQHRHAVTVIDDNPERVRRINDELDVKAMVGSASRSSIHFQAGVMAADICLAVTGNDEVNLLCASMAKAMGSSRSIARVYSPIYRDLSTFDYRRHFGIDRLLSLEHLSAMEFARGIRSVKSVALENFARGALEAQEFVVDEQTKSTGVPLKDLSLPQGVILGSICRGGRMWLAGGEDTIEPGDLIAVIGSREGIDKVKDSFQSSKQPRVSVVIAGGGETGYHLAKSLENARYSVLIIDQGNHRVSRLQMIGCLGNVRRITSDHGGNQELRG